MRILLICSANPTIGPARLSLDMKAAFEQVGHDVVLLTKYKVEGSSDIDYVLNQPSRLLSFWDRIKSFVFNHRQKSGYCFFYKNDSKPPVYTEKILNSVNGTFDLIYVLFWQGLISFETIDRLYDKYQVPFIFSAVDYSIMTGGCHFMHNCLRYENSCGKCPGYRSLKKHDFTWYNVEYRKRIYDKVRPVILTNSYSQPLFKRATLTKDCTFVNVPSVVNEHFFCPKEISSLRTKYNIPDNKKYILFFGCQDLSDKRKGMDLLVIALDRLFEQMTEEQRSSTLVLTAGRKDKEITNCIRFDIVEKGYVDFETLADLYSLADVFLSPSIVDAGPMMIAQAIMCGTPVVSFKIGLALDLVDGKGTGYCAEVGNKDDFVEGIIKYLFAKNKEEISKICRDVGMKLTSYESYTKLIEKAYYLAKNKH